MALTIYTMDWEIIPIKELDIAASSKLLSDDLRRFSPLITVVPFRAHLFKTIVLEWMKHHKDNPEVTTNLMARKTQEMSPWDKALLDIEIPLLHEVMFIAMYLEIPGLVDMVSQTLTSTQAQRGDIDHVCYWGPSRLLFHYG